MAGRCSQKGQNGAAAADGGVKTQGQSPEPPPKEEHDGEGREGEPRRPQRDFGGGFGAKKGANGAAAALTRPGPAPTWQPRRRLPLPGAAGAFRALTGAAPPLLPRGPGSSCGPRLATGDKGTKGQRRQRGAAAGRGGQRGKAGRGGEGSRRPQLDSGRHGVSGCEQQ